MNELYDGEVGICYTCGKEEGDLELAKDKTKNIHYYNMICMECPQASKNKEIKKKKSAMIPTIITYKKKELEKIQNERKK